MKTKEIAIPVSASIGTVTGEIMADMTIDSLFVFAHGAGAGMNHPFMVRLSQALAEVKIGTLRFNFPYMEKGSKRPDPPAVAEKSVNSAIEVAHEMFSDLPLLAGGKSFGGRMTSQALSKYLHPSVRGLVFTGFPLHPAGKPGMERAAHLTGIGLPMLFLQGTRDALADVGLITEVCGRYPLATLKLFEGADHSFKAGKQDLIPSLAAAIREWASATLANQPGR
ncbi:MAG TPA: alpha/beta family hydrolase [Chryseosolibacter sp.]|nr:alpha/beta family hydrolase [Chryseosolibacter sp.]